MCVCAEPDETLWCEHPESLPQVSSLFKTLYLLSCLFLLPFLFSCLWLHLLQVSHSHPRALGSVFEGSV